MVHFTHIKNHNVGYIQTKSGGAADVFKLVFNSSIKIQPPLYRLPSLNEWENQQISIHHLVQRESSLTILMWFVFVPTEMAVLWQELMLCKADDLNLITKVAKT